MRNHQFAGSYSSVRRFLQGLSAANPVATTVLEFSPAEAAQVDLGAGPQLVDTHTGELRSSWVFVMTLCFSRDQYAEVVSRQDVALQRVLIEKLAIAYALHQVCHDQVSCNSHFCLARLLRRVLTIQAQWGRIQAQFYCCGREETNTTQETPRGGRNI